ncbi:MAG: hypothetical protein VB934_22480 [Polyangiaceae bacterium]
MLPYLLYFASGAAALLYELVWLRILGGTFGVTLYANAAVLAAFMGGMAVGSYAAGRRATSRPLRSYGAIELGLAGYALVLPSLLEAAEVAYGGLAGDGALLTLLRFAGSLLLLGVPSALIGATFPILARCVGGEFGRASAKLYAAGAAGGVIAVLLGASWWLPSYGMIATGRLAAGISTTAALCALFRGRRGGHAVPVATTNGEGHRIAAFIALLSGASALVYELVWFRAISTLSSDTSFAVACVLAAFLASIALGSALAARLPKERRWTWLAAAQLFVAFYAVVSPHLLRMLAQTRYGISSGANDGSAVEPFGLALLVVLLPATFLGASLPLALALYGERRGRAAGDVYAANTLGAVLGALSGGLLLIPIFGARGALLFAAAANVAASRLAARHVDEADVGRLRLGLGPVLFAGAALLFFRGDAFFPPPPGEVMMRAEDASGVVQVVRDEHGHKHLLANRRHRWGSTHPTMLRAMRQQGYLPLLLHPRPREIIEIGLGTGVQLAPARLDDRVERIEVIELSPAIAEGARLFAAENEQLLQHANVVLGDGHHHLTQRRHRWDLIVLGLLTPYRPGAGRLFSSELYKGCAQRLRQGGLVIHWLPLAQLEPDALRSVVRTFVEVLPHTHAWQRAHYLALVGSVQPWTLSLDALRSRLDRPRWRDDLRRLQLDQPRHWLAGYVMGPAALARFSQGAPINTRNQPVVELNTRVVSAGRARRLRVDNLQRLLSWRESPLRWLSTVDPQIDAAHRARGFALRGVLAQARGDQAGAATNLRRAAAIDPNDEIVRSELRKYGKP